MNTQIAIATEQAPEIHPISLDFEEGQDVILLRGAKVHGLTTKCNQPGKIVHIQYSDEFGLTYVVQFGTLGMYAYVGANGLEAVAEAVSEPHIVAAVPLLSLYPEVDTADLMPIALDPLDTMELIGAGDTVLWNFTACEEPREGVIVQTKPNLDYVLVRFQFGAMRWIHIDEIQLVLKAEALERETASTEVKAAL